MFYPLFARQCLYNNKDLYLQLTELSAVLNVLLILYYIAIDRTLAMYKFKQKGLRSTPPPPPPPPTQYGNR